MQEPSGLILPIYFELLAGISHCRVTTARALEPPVSKTFKALCFAPAIGDLVWGKNSNLDEFPSPMPNRIQGGAEAQERFPSGVTICFVECSNYLQFAQHEPFVVQPANHMIWRGLRLSEANSSP
jgi:hypothetical protein